VISTSFGIATVFVSPCRLLAVIVVSSAAIFGMAVTYRTHRYQLVERNNAPCLTGGNILNVS